MSDNAQRLIEVIIGPCTKDELLLAMEGVSDFLDAEFPVLGAAIAGRFEVDTNEHAYRPALEAIASCESVVGGDVVDIARKALKGEYRGATS